MLAIDVFGLNDWGLGQAPIPAPIVPAIPAEPGVPARGTSTVVLPALPDNVAVRCRFDDRIGAWRCEHGGLFERPSTYVLIFGGLTLLTLGYFLGRTQLLGQVTKLIAGRTNPAMIFQEKK